MTLSRARQAKLDAALKAALNPPPRRNKYRAIKAETPAVTYRIAIPGWRPTTANELMAAQRGSHHAARRMKARDADMMARAKLVHGVPDATGKRRVRITVRNNRGRPLDPDAVLKSGLDALKRAHLIVDDSATWCEWASAVERGPKETIIEIEEIA